MTDFTVSRIDSPWTRGWGVFPDKQPKADKKISLQSRQDGVRLHPLGGEATWVVTEPGWVA